MKYLITTYSEDGIGIKSGHSTFEKVGEYIIVVLYDENNKVYAIRKILASEFFAASDSMRFGEA